MQEIINEKVSVISLYDRNLGIVKPIKIKWQGRIYPITKIGYHHQVRMGRKLLHIFSVANNSLAFRLSFDSETMHWTLEEVSDGLTN